MILPYFTVEFAKHGKNNCFVVTKNHLLLYVLLWLSTLCISGWTSWTFWSISKYRSTKFALHILPKHFRDPSTLIFLFPTCSAFSNFPYQFLAEIRQQETKCSVCLVPMEKKVPKANFSLLERTKGGKGREKMRVNNVSFLMLWWVPFLLIAAI